MWNSVIEILSAAINAVISWTTTLFNAVPGAWDAIFTLFVIIIICRYLLGPVLGVAFNAGSDKAKKKVDE